ncbi:protein-export chaperone SecB [Arthrobacter sp. Helios]|uniref:protein-export chaperone SecB n=1 Tax=Arthrobacter sp. Helios TaxID=2828862 RepID=UPI002051F490|nr:protein-export chaperone SecB [Arthrobacter sp. Helios]UPO77735.1 protein-export chaperone SecB [Arthrobacter sp. Helios]
MVKAEAEHLGFPSADRPLNYDLDVQPTAHFSPDSHALVVSADFSLDMEQASGIDVDDAETETRKIASLSFTLVALFDTPADATYEPDELDSFAGTTGIFSLYPYAREYVQDVTGRLGLPPLTLGVYRVSPASDAEGD